MSIKSDNRYRLLAKSPKCRDQFLDGFVRLFSVLSLDRCSVFPPIKKPKENGTKSYSDISFEAIFKATANVLERTQLVNYTGQSPFVMVSKYCGPGKYSYIAIFKNQSFKIRFHFCNQFQNLVLKISQVIFQKIIGKHLPHMIKNRWVWSVL